MKQFEMIGGELCLDFVNTIHEYGAADPREELESFEDLVAFANRAGTISVRDAGILQRKAAKSPKEAKQLLTTAREFRDSLYRIFSAVNAKREPSDQDWSLLNRLVSRVYRNVAIDKKGRNVFWTWREKESSLDRVLSPIVRSAAELLTSVKKRLVHECSSETCTWLFLDLSKNQTRRWCDMKKCGNRAKWHRHYDKTRKRQTRGVK